jgi:CheY-like chemotaxis protein
MKDTLFGILKNTVNVLAVDDRPDIILFIKEILDPFKVYTLTSAANTTEALDLIEKSENRFHVCLFDLGLDDVKNNEFLLLDNYGRIIPFVITSATEDTEKAFECKKRGAKDFVRKGTPDFTLRIIKSLNQQALHNMICPMCTEESNSPLCKYREILTTKKPEHINEWARHVDLTDRQLRHEWETHLGFSAKHSLCIFHLFSNLFKQIEEAYASNEMLNESLLLKHSQLLLNSTSYNRFLEYYLVNQRDVSATLNKSSLRAS